MVTVQRGLILLNPREEVLCQHCISPLTALYVNKLQGPMLSKTRFAVLPPTLHKKTSGGLNAGALQLEIRHEIGLVPFATVAKILEKFIVHQF